jgi:hypothetical protein
LRYAEREQLVVSRVEMPHVRSNRELDRTRL